MTNDCAAGEVLFEVIALLLMGVICTTALLLAAKLYKRRQSFRRHQQASIAAHRLRQLEKLHLLQQQQQQAEQQQLQRQLTNAQQKQLPQLKQHCPLGRSHGRQKSHDSVVPSSPSASSCQSEVIGTAVSTRSKPGKKASRARLAQREQASTQPHANSGRHLNKSHSDLSTDCHPPDSPELSHCSLHSLADSLHDHTSDPLFSGISQPSTPTSTAGLSAFFFTHSSPGHKHSQEAPSTPAEPTSKPSPKRKQSKHSRRLSKASQGKRRFIPGLDQQFDAAVHELPTALPDTSTAPKPKVRAAASTSNTPPSSSAALPQPSQASYPRRQLSVNAAPFVPTGYAHGCCQGPVLAPDMPLGWSPQSSALLHEDAYSYAPMRQTTSTPASPQAPLSPQSSLHSTAPSASPYSPQIESFPSVSMPWQCVQGWGSTPLLPQAPAKPIPRLSPTSVLPWALQADTPYRQPDWAHPITSSCAPMPGSASTSGGILLPPVLEEDAVNCLSGARYHHPAPLHADSSHELGEMRAFDASPRASSALLDLPRHLPVSSGRLPGFNSIWSTTDMPAQGLDSSSKSSWFSGTKAVSSSIW